jgi:hypothetical protein
MKKTRIAAVAVILVAIAMTVYGVFRGEMTDVFNKAVRICLECIGIG